MIMEYGKYLDKSNPRLRVDTFRIGRDAYSGLECSSEQRRAGS